MANNIPRWQGKTGGGDLGQQSLLWLLKHVPLKIVYGLLACVVPFYMLFAHKGYISIYRYFRKIWHYSVFKSFFATYKNHYLFGQTLIDKFVLFAGKTDSFVFEVENEALLTEAIEHGERIMLCSTHIGSFEILGYLIDTKSQPINSLVYGGEAAVMQQNRMHLFEKHHVKLIPIAEDMSHIFALKDAIFNGEIVSTYCDRSLDEHRMVEIDFLGMQAKFPLGPFQIASKFTMSCQIGRAHV